MEDLDFTTTFIGRPDWVNSTVVSYGRNGGYDPSYDSLDPYPQPIPVDLIKIPDTLIKVIQKSCPEVDYVIPINIDSEMRVSFPNYERCDIFLIDLKIVVNNNHRIRTNNEYEILFNRAFKAIHPEALFVRFYVRDVKVPRQMTNREKFINIFTK